MDFAACPECGHSASRMPVLSYISLTEDFYRCHSCGHVAVAPKTQAGAISAVPFTLPPQQVRAART